MSKKRKSWEPTNIKDLLDLFYSNRHYTQERKRYDDYTFNILSKTTYEQYVKNHFAKLGIVEKVPENTNKKTPDYVIHRGKIVFEVKSINDIRDPFMKIDEIINKIDKLVNEAESKDFSAYERYHKGVVVLYPCLSVMHEKQAFQAALCSWARTALKTTFFDFIAIMPAPVSINDKSSEKLCESYYYCKTLGIAEKLKPLGPSVFVF